MKIISEQTDGFGNNGYIQVDAIKHPSKEFEIEITLHSETDSLKISEITFEEFEELYNKMEEILKDMYELARQQSLEHSIKIKI